MAVTPSGPVPESLLLNRSPNRTSTRDCFSRARDPRRTEIQLLGAIARAQSRAWFCNTDGWFQEFSDHSEKTMAVKHEVSVSIDPPTYRPTATQRRAALTAAIAGQQQTLKREAAERRAKRARDGAQPVTARRPQLLADSQRAAHGVGNE
jgi:hypothetical protein